MATKLANLDLEIQHFYNFYDALPGAERWCQDTVHDLISLGCMQVSTLFEHAVAASAGTTVTSEDTHDLENGWEIKLASVRWHGKAYGAPITNISGKTGSIRAQVYERMLDEFYYFVIPHEAYSRVGKNSNIEIPFFDDGTPKLNYRPRELPNWWDFEVASWNELVGIKKPSARRLAERRDQRALRHMMREGLLDESE